MKKTFGIILAISLILLATSFGLRSVTEKQAQKEHIKLMQTLLPNSKDFIKVDYNEQGTAIRTVHKASNGYVIEALTEGYSDEITMLIGVNNDGVVTGLVTYRAHETVGLGSKILTDHKFLSQFLNKSGSFAVTNDKKEDEISVDGISGATVSSKAVAKCVNAAVAYVTGADIESSATEWGGR